MRRRNGGRWELGEEQSEWRVVLPTGLNFSPIGFVASAIAQADLDDLDSELDAPPRMQPYVKSTLERMGEVTIEDTTRCAAGSTRSSTCTRSWSRSRPR